MNNNFRETPIRTQNGPAFPPGQAEPAPAAPPARDERQEEAELLWAQYRKSRTIENKNRLVVHYVPLVNRIVGRLVPMHSAGEGYEDLVGYGILGLIDAVDKYSPERSVRFETYAIKRIKGEIIDSMRRQDWAPASLRARIKQIERASAELEAEGLEADDEEIAAQLGLDVAQVRQASEKAYMFNVLHFESLLSGAMESGQITLMDGYGTPQEEDPGESLEKEELAQVLAAAIEKLPPAERRVVTLYYYEEFMLKDIASIMGVTPARVSQIHGRAIAKIKKALLAYLAPAPD